jgi:hypothetical protein
VVERRKDAARTTTAPKKDDKRRPIQVVMTWMDTFRDNEKIQVKFYGRRYNIFILHTIPSHPSLVGQE